VIYTTDTQNGKFYLGYRRANRTIAPAHDNRLFLFKRNSIHVVHSRHGNREVNYINVDIYFDSGYPERTHTCHSMCVSCSEYEQEWESYELDECEVRDYILMRVI